MQRNSALDFVRGLAILGILLLNINAFALPAAAYLNPAWHGMPSAADIVAWAVTDAVARMKCLMILALLFGAGLQMQLSRGKIWLKSRLLWLAVFGFIHAVFFWQGDILLNYAITGLMTGYILGHIPDTRRLFYCGIMLYLTGVAMLIIFALLSDGKTDHNWLPDAAVLRYEATWKMAGGWQAVIHRLHDLISGLLAMGTQYGWQLLGVMLIGAGLLRSGWLSGAFSQQHYRWMGFILISVASVLQLPTLFLQHSLQWDFRWCGYLLQVPFDLAAPLQAAGYIALCLAYWPRLAALKLSYAVCCTGRMALSNYLLQTLICSTLFYRCGWFMQLSRFQLWRVVVAVWLINMTFSVLWLSRYRQGPAEWLWRRLTALTAEKRGEDAHGSAD